MRATTEQRNGPDAGNSRSALVLLDKPECPFCWKVRIALVEKGLPFERLDHRTATRPPAALQLNPSGTVPILIDGGHVVADSALALEYLEDRYPERPLLPPTVELRATARALHHYASGVIGAALRPVIFEKRDKAPGEWRREVIEQGTAAWSACLDTLAELLGDAEWFAGAFSFAECALLPRFGLAAAYGLDPIGGHGNLARWLQQTTVRPSFRETAPPVVPDMAAVTRPASLSR